MQFTLLLVMALIIIPVAAGGENTTNSTTFPTLAETNLTMGTTFPVNATETVNQTNVTPGQIPMNSSVTGAPSAISTPAGSSVIPSSTGNLTVASSPLGASVLLDGIFYGNTPQNVSGISAGNHIVRLTLSGYYDYEGTIYVVPGQVTSVFGTLPPSTGSSSGSTTPATVTTGPVIAVQPTSTSSGGLLENPTILAALIGIVTASIGAFAAIFPHLSKSKK
jgi:hypothetical protein